MTVPRDIVMIVGRVIYRVIILCFAISLVRVFFHIRSLCKREKNKEKELSLSRRRRLSRPMGLIFG